MIAIFFVGVWGLLMGLLIREYNRTTLFPNKRLINPLHRTDYSKIHSWLLPVFAVGLGCPRWCQMWWGVSGVGLYVPWGGVAGPYL